jgi:hypothetical protein
VQSSHTGHTAMGHAAGPSGLAVASSAYLLDPAGTRFQPGQPARFSFRILDHEGQPVTAFVETHQRAMHLIVVRRDLTDFQHLHPELGPDGTWSTELILPSAGVHRAFADFATEHGPLTLGVDLFAVGQFDPVDLPAPEATARVGDYVVTLQPGDEPGALRFLVTAAGELVTDLEPYLGALGHLVALREGDLAFLHVHPESNPTSGPAVQFHANFPSAGHYRLFLQFQHHGRVNTVAFTIRT